MDVKDNAQINIVNARKTILVAIASVHVIVEKDARTEILNFTILSNTFTSNIYLFQQSNIISKLSNKN